MSDFIKLKSLKEIEDKYDIFFIDLWGVIHNGLQLFESIENVLNRLKKKNKVIFFYYKCSQKIICYSRSIE